MKISILLPFKENFSPDYAGAVSLFINDTIKYSKFKHTSTVYGYTEYKKKFQNSYVNIETSNRLFFSSNKDYVKKFISIEKKSESDLIEIHNRPIYLNYLVKSLSKRNYILYFHNDPLSMNGSSSKNDRIFLLKNCFKIIFNSNWSKKRFLDGMSSDAINSEKLTVINQSAAKNKIQIKRKKKYYNFCW